MEENRGRIAYLDVLVTRRLDESLRRNLNNHLHQYIRLQSRGDVSIEIVKTKVAQSNPTNR